MSPKGKITILVADDQLIAREGLTTILETSEEIKVIGEARTTIEAIEKSGELTPDILLMDLKWFGDDNAGWTAISEIKRKHLKTKIIALTAYGKLIRGAKLAGADAALLKTFTRDELLNEIFSQISEV
jgi:DNA-binding NarL/FixJ family response regulator